jgi:hypothetical protein
MSRKLPGTLYHTMGCEVMIFSGNVNVFLVSDRLYPTPTLISLTLTDIEQVCEVEKPFILL